MTKRFCKCAQDEVAFSSMNRCLRMVSMFLGICVIGFEAHAQTMSCADAGIKDIDEALIEAAASGVHREVLANLEAGADPNIRDDTCHTATLWAARAGHSAVLLDLVEYGGDLTVSLPAPDGRNGGDFVDRHTIPDIEGKLEEARRAFSGRNFVLFSERGEHRRAIAMIQANEVELGRSLGFVDQTPLSFLLKTRSNTDISDRDAIFEIPNPENAKGWGDAVSMAVQSSDWQLLEFALPFVDSWVIARQFKELLMENNVSVARRMIAPGLVGFDERIRSLPGALVSFQPNGSISEDVRKLVREVFDAKSYGQWEEWARIAVIFGDEDILRKAAPNVCTSSYSCEDLKSALALSWTADTKGEFTQIILSQEHFFIGPEDVSGMFKSLGHDRAIEVVQQLGSKVSGQDLEPVLEEQFTLLANGSVGALSVIELLIREFDAPVAPKNIDRITQSSSIADPELLALSIVFETGAWKNWDCDYSSRRSLTMAKGCGDRYYSASLHCESDWYEKVLDQTLGYLARTEDLSSTVSVIGGLAQLCEYEGEDDVDLIVSLFSAILSYDEARVLAGLVDTEQRFNGDTFDRVCAPLLDLLTRVPGQEVSGEDIMLFIQSFTPSGYSAQPNFSSVKNCGRLIGRGVPGTSDIRVKFFEAMGLTGIPMEDIAIDELRRLNRFGGDVGTALAALRFSDPGLVARSTIFSEHLEFVAANPKNRRTDLLVELFDADSNGRAARWALNTRFVADGQSIDLPEPLRKEIDLRVDNVGQYLACDARVAFSTELLASRRNCPEGGECSHFPKVAPILNNIVAVNDNPIQSTCAKEMLDRTLNAKPSESYALAVSGLLTAGVTTDAQTIEDIADNWDLRKAAEGAEVMGLILERHGDGGLDDVILRNSSRLCDASPEMRSVIETYLENRAVACN
ncbi:ankyrin repeat domain-containing protein [Shimia sp. R9_2]|uniref:ankyrin repeat domain-containing protein n=1 Tax=Shimia sp. R9_2 TaxID=2821112 RepID=UPI001ADB6932|nr:ankyrin repeat domain-containing protein [Shimia sp. R9_2]MBO9398115.1 ankyrin repeat domain-containing protein [Shimia sp. R9_2]